MMPGRPSQTLEHYEIRERTWVLNKKKKQKKKNVEVNKDCAEQWFLYGAIALDRGVSKENAAVLFSGCRHC